MTDQEIKYNLSLVTHIVNERIGKMIAEFNEKWEAKEWHFKKNFLTEDPLKKYDYAGYPITAKDYTKLMQNIVGVEHAEVTQMPFHSVEVKFIFHKRYLTNRILSETLKMDCRNVVEYFRPISLQINLRFPDFDKPLYMTWDKHLLIWQEIMWKWHHPLDSALQIQKNKS